MRQVFLEKDSAWCLNVKEIYKVWFQCDTF